MTLERPYTYRMPAEWTPHCATWLAWPHRQNRRSGESATRVALEREEGFTAQIAVELSIGERVEILVENDKVEARARKSMAREGEARRGRPENVHFHQIPTNNTWIRDSGPVFVDETYRSPDNPGAAPQRRQALLDWGFNAYGGKFPPWDDDNAIPLRIASGGAPPRDWLVLQPGMMLEGGSIDVNGAGTLLTTESCLLNPNRNPSMSRDEIEAALKRWLGVETVYWACDGIPVGHTDGHVDDFTRFVSEDTILTAVENDSDDASYTPLAKIRTWLETVVLPHEAAAGRPCQIVEIPMPSPVFDGSERLTASYLNFYIGNEVVLFPTFDQPCDGAAREIFQSIWPERRIIGIDSLGILAGGATLRRSTLQQPTTPT